MNLVSYKAIAAFLVFLISIITIIYPLRRKQTLQHTGSVDLGEGLASGIFLGAAFFHMLPGSINMFADIYGPVTYPIPEVICIGGFLLLLFLERLSLTRVTTGSSQSIPYVLVIILIIHALTEGAALGINATYTETLLLFVAILAHKGSESFALCVILLRNHFPLRHIISIVTFFALMTPLGIGLGEAVNLFAFATSGKIAAAVFNAFAAGTFLYMSTLHHIRFHQHQHSPSAHGMREFGCLVLGLLTMGVIAAWV